MKNVVLQLRKKRQRRVRSKIIRQSEMPRLSVYRSNKYIYAQVIDDFKNKTLAAVNEKTIKGTKITKTERAKQLGTELAGKLKNLKIKQVVFDRGAYAYNGRIKALAEAVRENGITI